MKKVKVLLFAVAAAFVAAPAALAQATSTAAPTPTSWLVFSSGIAYAVAVAGCAIAQGKATVAACEGLARNPGAAAAIRLSLILGLVFIESLSLYMFAVLYLKL
jgi:F-type H+-transporting ATPase subunit c